MLLRLRPLFCKFVRYFKTNMNAGECGMIVGDCSRVTIYG